MQRYTVTVVTASDAVDRPTLAIPFEPAALVSALGDEVFRRVEKRGFDVSPDTHTVTLRLYSQTGAILDSADVLAYVVPDPRNEPLFAMFADQRAVRVADSHVKDETVTFIHIHVPVAPTE